jgi:hypothetical protein
LGAAVKENVMKIYAHYDSEGNIHSLIAADEYEGLEVSLSPKPGLLVGEIEGLEVKDAQDLEALRKIVESYRVSTPNARIKLSKKS